MINLRLWWNLISCTFTHPKNMPKVYIKPHGNETFLEPYDILLFHGHSILNKAIQGCIDSKYNHVALYVGNGRVLHAVGEGLIIQSLQEAWSSSDKFISVYRYKGLITYVQRDKMNEIANKYYTDRNSYSVVQLLELGIMTLLTDEDDYFTVAQASEMVNHALNGKKEQMICSEIVYRVFNEAGVPLPLPDNEFTRMYKASGINVIPDFVTPKDFSMNDKLRFVGDLVKEF